MAVEEIWELSNSRDRVLLQSGCSHSIATGDHIMSRFLLSALVSATVLALTSGGVASAETSFPNKPIKIILALPAGSALDVITRVTGEGLTSRWGQQVIVE